MTRIWKKVEPRVVGLLKTLVHIDRRAKLFIVLVSDALLCIAAVIIGFSLRLGEWDLWTRPIATVSAIALVIWLPTFAFRGIYRSVVRFIGLRTMLEIATSALLMVIGLALIFSFSAIPDVPRTIAVIQPMIFAGLLVVSRLIARYALFDLLNQRNVVRPREYVLIYGAGSAGRQLAVSLRHEAHMVLSGYIDDDKRLAGKHLDGVRVHGSNDLAYLIERDGISLVLLAMPGVSRQQREQIVRKFEHISVRVLTLPAIGHLLDGSVSVGDLREIEIADLLGRDSVEPNYDLLHRTVSERTVMVTGAGGSIGSELCRQIVLLNPVRVILVEMTEHALYSIEGELREKAAQFDKRLDIRAELGSVSDADTVHRLFERWSPDIVFHAAAYKHVPLVEDNVISGMRNNIFGTLHCAMEARRTGARHFVLVSTDKAVRPTNVMGASKRVCELILQALAESGGDTKFAIVRFGNVLGSSGSVVPHFQRQIREGGPVTLTHRDVTRFFMTIPEASQLVIQAGAMSEGGEVYVLDMGEPIRIYDLAATMINLSGRTVRDAANPDGDIEIREIGLRKGEKLYEELLIGNSPQLTQHPRIMQARETMIGWPELSAQLDELREVLVSGERGSSLRILSNLVPEFVGQQSFNRPENV